MHGGQHIRSFINAEEEKPQVTKELLKRVMTYAGPYRWQIFGMFVFILSVTGLNLLTPLIMRDMIDHTIPDKNIPHLLWLTFFKHPAAPPQYRCRRGGYLRPESLPLFTPPAHVSALFHQHQSR
jgi:hypothetical protein